MGIEEEDSWKKAGDYANKLRADQARERLETEKQKNLQRIREREKRSSDRGGSSNSSSGGYFAILFLIAGAIYYQYEKNHKSGEDNLPATANLDHAYDTSTHSIPQIEETVKPKAVPIPDNEENSKETIIDKNNDGIDDRLTQSRRTQELQAQKEIQKIIVELKDLHPNGFLFDAKTVDLKKAIKAAGGIRNIPSNLQNEMRELNLENTIEGLALNPFEGQSFPEIRDILNDMKDLHPDGFLFDAKTVDLKKAIKAEGGLQNMPKDILSQLKELNLEKAMGNLSGKNDYFRNDKKIWAASLSGNEIIIVGRG